MESWIGWWLLLPVFLLNQCGSSPLYFSCHTESLGNHEVVHEGVHGVYLRRESHWNVAQQDDFDDLVASGGIHAYVCYLLTLYPSAHHLPDLGLCVNQWLQLYDLIGHELNMEEITINGGEKGSDAIEARTSSHANWNTFATLDRNLSKPASVVDLRSTNQTLIFMR